MSFLADLHIHSRYAYATSKNLNLETLYQWAQIKGISVIGTGDFTHPAWFSELREKLVEDGNGLFRLKNPPKVHALEGIRPTHTEVRFLLSTEISSVYKHKGKTRKNHNLVYSPNFETVEKLIAQLGQIGNLAADGRPTLKLSSRDLLEIVREASDEAYLIPAHIWTPWFSTFGSKSGYDSLEDCFEDLTKEIFALETGLSSDPDMNRRVSMLDNYTLVSNSDAHSAPNLGREANRFETDRTYKAIFQALRSGKGFGGTYEFFPQEGKYHLDGHRKCAVVTYPDETKSIQGICPVCKKPLIKGVLFRVEELADRNSPHPTALSQPYQYLVPLPEILGEILNKGPKTKTVTRKFIQLISEFGNEFSLIHEVPLSNIRSKGFECEAKALENLRTGKVHAQPGFDGQYGSIQLLEA
ncbi:MAG: endonuclease Q family protein [Bacteroidota bacterium]